MNRMLAVSPATVAAAKPTQARVIHRRADRRVTPSSVTSGPGDVTSFSGVAIRWLRRLPNRRADAQGVGKRQEGNDSFRDRLGRLAGRVAHAQVGILARDLLEQRQAVA